MKKLLFLLCILAASMQVQAQQDHQYTQFMYNKLLINPGYAGARGVPSVTGIYRNQWLGFDGAPQSALVSFNSPFLHDRVGVGATVSHMKIGLQRDFYASLAYSYDLVAGEVVSFRAGIMGSVRSFSMDFTEANPDVIGDNSFPANDNLNKVLGNVGAGLYGTFLDRYYVGFSVPRIYRSTLGVNTDPTATTTAKEAQHFYGMGGAIIPISDDISLMPAVLVKYVKNAPFDMDINLNLDIREKFTAGVSYRLGGDGMGESVDLLAFWQATPQFGVGAAYDFSLSKLRDYNAGSVELMVQADLKKKKKRKLSNPRFFM